LCTYPKFLGLDIGIRILSENPELLIEVTAAV